MDIFFPAQTLPLFQAFAPCFTAPSFAYFQSYEWALMVVEGRQCMTRLARCACFQRVRRALRAWATRQIILANATPGADVEKIARDHEPLLQMLV